MTLRKVYDKVDLHYLDQLILKLKGFSKRCRRWIQGCLSSSNFSIMINGRLDGRFGLLQVLEKESSFLPFSRLLLIPLVVLLMFVMIKGSWTDLEWEWMKCKFHTTYVDDTFLFFWLSPFKSWELAMVSECVSNCLPPLDKCEEKISYHQDKYI